MPTASQTQKAEPEQGTGCYVYGVVPADVEVTEETEGVGDPPGTVRLVRCGELAALVSDVELSRGLGTPDDLRAHQEILDGTAAESPVLPLRFGAVLTSEDAVVEELLEPHHDEFAAALEELEGRAEYVVKGRYVERAILGEIVSENDEAARLRDEIRDRDADATRDARIRLGEIVSEAIAARREEDTRELVSALDGHYADHVLREPTHEFDAVHVALLADTSREADLDRAVEDLGKRWSGRVELRLLGPMAPYDFVGTAEDPEA